MEIRRGTTVVITAGKDRGKQGQIERVIAGKQKVVVSGLNMIKRHVKPSQKFPSGGIIETAAPIHQSNLKIVDAEVEKPQRTTKQSKV